MNPAQILQQYYYQTDFVDYVAQFSFPVDYIGPEHQPLFPGQRPDLQRPRPRLQVVLWPVGSYSRDDLRQLFRLDPELVVTNKP